MRILEIKVLQGPNYWSSYRKNLIQMKIDICGYENCPTNKIEGFSERIQSLLPSMYEHECSEKKPGGFFQRVKEGTWMGHVAEHIALELQTLAGMDVGYGRTRSTSATAVYHMVFEYKVKSAGIYAGKAALRIVQALSENTEYNIQEDIDELIQLNRREGLAPISESMVDAVKKS